MQLVANSGYDSVKTACSKIWKNQKKLLEKMIFLDDVSNLTVWIMMVLAMLLEDINVHNCRKLHAKCISGSAVMDQNIIWAN